MAVNPPTTLYPGVLGWRAATGCVSWSGLREIVMSFSLPRFVRRAQPSDLQGYFGARAIFLSERVDWTAKSSVLVESVKTAIEVLSEREREQVFEDFERIDQLSDDIGQRALRSLIEHDEAL